jgi:hypothetical protein
MLVKNHFGAHVLMVNVGKVGWECGCIGSWLHLLLLLLLLQLLLVLLLLLLMKVDARRRRDQCSIHL